MLYLCITISWMENSGFIKRTKADEYRAQHRGGKGIKGAKLREDDVVDHFFLTSTHNWLLFFTNKGRVYRLKAYELPEGSRDSKGQHVANLLQFGPDETIQTVLSIPNYDVAKYLVLATRSGKVKKTALAEYDSPRQGGLIAVRIFIGWYLQISRIVFLPFPNTLHPAYHFQKK